MKTPFKSPEERAQYKAWQVETADQRRLDAENAVIEARRLDEQRDERTARLRAMRIAAQAETAPAAPRRRAAAKGR